MKRLSLFLEFLDYLTTITKLEILNAGDIEYMADKSDSVVISNVFQYVAENFQKEISFSKAAYVANMQKAAFCRYFKRKTKKKFSTFVNYYLIMSMLKMFLLLIIAAIYIYLKRDDAIRFALALLVLFFSYLVFEVVWLLRIKNNS